jgi:hypothetical protein
VDALLWEAAGLVALLALLFSLGPAPTLFTFSWIDKAQHVAGYATLCGLVLLAAVWRRGRGVGRFPNAAFIVCAAVTAYGWIIEFAQIPFGRDAAPWDGLADLAGVAAAYGLWRLWRSRISPWEGS